MWEDGGKGELKGDGGRELAVECGEGVGGHWHPLRRTEGWVREGGDICPQPWPLPMDCLC